MHSTVRRKAGIWFSNMMKYIVFVLKGFKEDQIILRASALTLYTLLSIVPVMAMAFGLAKGFGMQKLLEKELYTRFPGQDEILNTVLVFSNNLLEGTKGGIMAILGVIVLIYSVIKMFNHIENAFNAIWWVRKGRPWIRKFTDYIALFITAPLLILISGSATIFIATQMETIFSGLNIPYMVQIMISFGFKIVPFITIWVLFIFFYIFIPNKKVSIKAAIVGGVLAGSIFQIGQILYVNFQVGVSHYNAIYGSFAALPLFLIWLQASWIILLVGAEFAFVWENSQALEKSDGDYHTISIKLKKIMALRIVMVCVNRFANRQWAPSGEEIREETKIPLQIVKQLLSDLVDCRILSEVQIKESQGFAPAHDIETMTLTDVIHSFEKFGDENVQVPDTLEYQAIEESLAAFEKAAVLSEKDRRIKDI